ncbi:DUF6979 family protein [Undibacterium sp.]|uniref:DUF6979 family protein n=1 Tax=Undibacterium sp. TaxID=1914977 RepID=UPI00374D4581
MNRNNSNYGSIAIEAASAAAKGVSPILAWEIAAAKKFPNSPTSATKNCPKCAFLGLAESGEIIGIPSGSYTKSKDNKKYALSALSLLRSRKLTLISSKDLWIRVMEGVDKQHNSQMDVVLALWDSGRIANTR